MFAKKQYKINMIYDKINNLYKYKGINKNLDFALEWLEKNNYKNVELGITSINKDIWIKKIKSSTLNDDNLICEIHYKTTDIHLFSEHDDNIIYQLNNEVKSEEILKDYDSKEDVMFFKPSTKEMIVPVKKDTFAIFFPHEVHCPRRNQKNSVITKTILKVRM